MHRKAAKLQDSILLMYSYMLIASLASIKIFVSNPPNAFHSIVRRTRTDVRNIVVTALPCLESGVRSNIHAAILPFSLYAFVDYFTNDTKVSKLHARRI
jgi:hypothetical protein